PLCRATRLCRCRRTRRRSSAGSRHLNGSMTPPRSTSFRGTSSGLPRQGAQSSPLRSTADFRRTPRPSPSC
ncbi:unnamed protein product, partial [Effrenium voratum]